MSATALVETSPARRLAPWVIAGTLLIPVILVIVVFPAPMGDLREQIAWGRHFPLVTPRHPPMMAWTSGVVDLFFGPSMLAQMVAGQVLLLVGLLYVHATLRLVADEAGAFLFTFLYATSFCFSVMPLSWVMNADLLQVMSWPAVVFHFLQASRSNRWLHWLAFAVFSAVAILTKYTAILLFAGMVTAILSVPGFRATLRQFRLYVAVLVGVLLVAPHAIALSGHNAAIGFGLRFFGANHSLADYVASLASIVGGYFHYLFPAWLVIVLGFLGRALIVRAPGTKAEFPDAVRFVLVLNAAILIFAALLVIFGGLNYQPRFNAPLTALGVLAVAPLIGWRVGRQASGEIAVVRGVGIFNFAAAVAAAITYTFLASHNVTQEPVKEPTETILGDWNSRYSCGPAWVIGHRRAAQLVGLNTPGASTIALEDLLRGPSWFDPADLRDRGAIVIYYVPIPDDLLQPVIPEATLTAERVFTAPLLRTWTGAALTYHYRFFPPTKCPG
ncbi:MAG: glycosyltransferase family 39 protein [Bauldia sp.]